MTTELAQSETPKWDRLVWDLLILVTFAVMALILAPLLEAMSNNASFQAGRTNDLKEFNLAMGYFLLKLLTLVGLWLLLSLMLVRIWMKRRAKVLLALRVGMLLLMAGLFVVPFLFSSPAVEPHSRGFQQWAKENADVEAIRAWAGTLHGVEGNTEIKPSLWPPVVARLSPIYVSYEDANTVRLSWGGGHIGAFGIVVGPATMANPETGQSQRILDLAPGAYVFLYGY
jgi:hypothetical protein